MSGTADKPPSDSLLIQAPPPAPLASSYDPPSPGYYSDSDGLTAAERATASRQSKGIETPTTRALGMGADTVDLERAKLVEALQETFKAHMNKKIASTGVDRDDFVEANIVLEKVKANLKEELKDIYNNLHIDDAGLRLILNKINSTLNSIRIASDGTLNPDIIDETISSIVNERIPTSMIVEKATKRQRTLGGKTNRKKRTHRKNKKHKTNRRKHKTYRRKHRKTRKN